MKTLAFATYGSAVIVGVLLLPKLWEHRWIQITGAPCRLVAGVDVRMNVASSATMK